MIKFIEYSGADNYGTHIELLHPDVMIKTAEYSPELASYVKDIKPEDNKTFVLINAMGSGEHYGANRNGDYFPEDSLVRYHKTFEKLGRAYKHHKNKDPERSYGKVKFAHYNPSMHRVELIVELDKTNPGIEDILASLERGEYPATSMGVRLPYDECSICGQKSKTTADYCNHLKYEMNRVYPDGRKVSALNRDNLKFFDISFVRIPADRTSGVMAKLASGETKPVESSAKIAEAVLKRAGIKEADLIKEIDGEVKGINDDPRKLIYNSQMEMPVSELEQILSHYSLSELLSTLLGLRIMPTKTDFQRMVAIGMRHPDMSKICSAAEPLFVIDATTEPLIPEDVSLDNFSDGIAQKIAHWIPQMSLTKPLIIKRAMSKLAAINTLPDAAATASSGQKSPFIPMLSLGALYLGYNKLMDGARVPRTLAQSANFEEWILSKPQILPLIIAGAAAATAGAQWYMRKNMVKQAASTLPYAAPHYLKRMLIGVPATYLYAGYQENKLRQGQQISDFANLVRKHPFLASLGVTYGLHKGPQMLRGGLEAAKVPIKTAELNVDQVLMQLSPEKLDELYFDVIGAPIT